MKLNKVSLHNHFQENVDTVLIETKVGQFRIIGHNGGLKISLLAEDGVDNISIHPKATNMVVIHKSSK